jgi:hypothetical protein
VVRKEEAVQVLPEGQYIRHEQYGLGVVRESDPERTTIDFDSFGLKKFVTSLMVAEVVSDVTANASRPRRRRKTVTSRARAQAR